ncbi:MAG: isoprenylcysteine carboxylmethyltransferase family protein [Elusimicrobia bacterium]|nr:isoprenylcysteine carboxylmethyltransferase family protein [Elusimicrobiota bacterium]MDE2425522.1 isoprenylcysteine carboxylmethyltransferase family protein [Elusimicrobiota bacterium]
MEFWLPYLLIAVILVGEACCRGSQRPDASRRDSGSIWVFILVLALAYEAAFILSRRPPHLGVWAAWLGAALTLSGMALRVWAVKVLGVYFTRSVQVSSAQKVVEAGPYRLIRHPSYTGGIAAQLGVGLALRSVLSLSLLALGALLAYGYRIHVEEAALGEALGQPYRDYMRRTWRLVPFLF